MPVPLPSLRRSCLRDGEVMGNLHSNLDDVAAELLQAIHDLEVIAEAGIVEAGKLATQLRVMLGARTRTETTLLSPGSPPLTTTRTFVDFDAIDRVAVDIDRAEFLEELEDERDDTHAAATDRLHGERI